MFLIFFVFHILTFIIETNQVFYENYVIIKLLC